MLEVIADFETTGQANYNKYGYVHVWQWQVRRIDNYDVIGQGTDINTFFDFIQKQSLKIYFHNLKFDGMFVLSELFNRGYKHVPNLNDTKENKVFETLITDLEVFYCIKIRHIYHNKKPIVTHIWDSFKKLPLSVSKIGKAFGLQYAKGEIDYEKFREVGYEPTPAEWEYINNDTLIVAQALHKQKEKGLDKMTIGADCISYYKKLIGENKFKRMYPSLAYEIDEFCRKSYKGGYVYANPKYINKVLENVSSYDVNSLYPYVMYTYLLPFGHPVKYEGAPYTTKHYPLFIHHFACKFELKEGYLPTLQVKGYLLFKDTEYLITSNNNDVELIMTSVDYELFLRHYNVWDIRHFGGYAFQATQGIFREYIEYWYNIKSTTKDAGERTIAKLYLNNLYGKFGTSMSKRQKYPYLDDDGIVKMKIQDAEIDEGIYVPVASFITANARKITIENSQKLGDYFVYADTDSNKILEGADLSHMDIDDKRLGAWKYEGTADKFKVLRAKAYIAQYGDKLKITCAGMTDEAKEMIKTIDDFDFNAKFIKRVQKKVKGGVMLVDTEYTIKN